MKNRMGDRAGAKEVFERAMRTHPTYLFAGSQFFAIQKDERDYEGAARTLEILKLHASPEQILALRVELEVAQAHASATMTLIRELCRNPEYDRQMLASAIEAVARPEWQKKLEQTLQKVLDEPTWNAATPWLWARVRVRRSRYGSLRHYGKLAAMGDAGMAAIYEFLGALGNEARKASGETNVHGWFYDVHIALIRYCCREWRTNDTYWGKLGFALLCRNRVGAVVRWTRDWRERPNAESWMLQNVAIAMLARQRDDEALAVLRHVVKTFITREDIGHNLKLWGALGACVDGDLAMAERLLHESPEEAIPKADRPIRAFAVALLELLRSDHAQTRLDADQKAALDAAVEASKTDAAANRLVALSRRKIAERLKNPWMKLVAWRHLNPRLTAVAMFLAVITAFRVLSVLAP
jgi:hypothetical protein